MSKSVQKRTVLSGIFWQFAERFGAQLVTFVVSIVLARMLSPEHYGTISILLIFINIANVFVSNSFNTSLVQKKDADDLDFSSLFYFNIVFSLVLYALIFFTAPVIESFYEMENLSLALRILALKIPIAGVNSIQQAYVSRHMMFRKFFFATLGGTITSAFVGIAMAYRGFGALALVGQYLTNSVIGTVILAFTIQWKPKWMFSFARLKVLFDYGWKILLTYLLRTISDDINSIIIGKKYSKEDLAFFTKGKQYPNLLINNVNTSISSVLLPTFSKVQDDPREMKGMLRRSIKISSYILSPLLFGLGVVAEPLVSILLTDKWLPCVPYLQVSCVYLLFMPISNVNQQAIKALGKSSSFLILEIIKRVMGIILVICAMNYGVMAIALSTLLTTVIGSVINTIPINKYFNYSYIQQLMDILPSILLSSVMALVVYLMNYIKINPAMLLSMQIIAGIGIYAILSLIMKNKEFNYIITNVKAFLKKKR